MRPTALIADDEPLLRDRLAGLLARLWPDLEVVAQARNGKEAIELFDVHRPQIVFLDVHMPGASGIDAARAVARRAQIVFITAFDQYAIEAFERGAIDYLLKPVEVERLAETVERLKERQAASQPAQLMETLDALAAQWTRRMPVAAEKLQWIKASVGSAVRLIAVDQVIYLKSDSKYTLVVWDGGEALIRKTIREMADALDPKQFVQVHRSCIVNLGRVAQFSHAGDADELQLQGRAERLAVSRSYLHLFQQM